MRSLFLTTTRAIPSPARCLAIINRSGYRGAASSTTARFSAEKRQRLLELRKGIDSQRTAQARQDEENCKKHLRRFDMSWINDALCGLAVPPMMDLELARRAVIRGIRYNDGFATELHGTDPRFTRALNAQAIMANRIPEMHDPGDFPYCIWHPNTPSQDTCRALLQRHPQMKYQVGRVCAIAGYTELYHSLNLLPEIHIAEEARDANNLSIYRSITSHPLKYAVFNDYSRTYTPSSPRPALINGDTCVRSMLEIKQRYTTPYAIKQNQATWHRHDGFEVRHFDITEDMSIDTCSRDAPKTDQAVVLPLLYNPLPADLPTVQKDLLILMAAAHGDIDRYARLHRPHRIAKETACLVRGIYHHALFAKWVSQQPSTATSRFATPRITKALHARFIMSNNLDRLTPATPAADLPYCIWYPDLADCATYVRLAATIPRLRIPAARACIAADYPDTYAAIDPPWDRALARDAARKAYIEGWKFAAGDAPALRSRGRTGWDRGREREMRGAAGLPWWWVV